MAHKPHILVIDDELDIRTTVADILEDEGYHVALAENAEAGRRQLRERLPDAVLLDIWMQDTDGISLLKEWKEQSGGELPSPVIIMSGHGNIETAVEATRYGAYDFLEKPLSIAKLTLVLERALQSSQLEQRQKQQEEVIPEPEGKSPVMQRLREQVRRIAQYDTWVLIKGESGSGRETFAHYLHRNSNRAQQPFVNIVVSSLSEEGAARALFGYEEKGQVRYGRLDQARGGILFLDEVASMSLDIQKQFVGALESGNFTRIGGAEPAVLDVRVIAATEKNLEGEVNRGRFLESLYYQLNVVPLVIPPLRDHIEDISDLLHYYSEYFALHERLPYKRFAVSAQNILRQYRWPGNVRELKNLVQRLLILSEDTEITAEDIHRVMGPSQTVIDTTISPISYDQPLRNAREDFERAYLSYQFKKNSGNVGEMAEEVGMERTHLYRKLKGLGIDTKAMRKQ